MAGQATPTPPIFGVPRVSGVACWTIAPTRIGLQLAPGACVCQALAVLAWSLAGRTRVYPLGAEVVPPRAALGVFQARKQLRRRRA